MKPHGSYISDIILLLFFTVLTLLSIFNPILSNTFLKPVLGIIFVAFIPGYALISFLFPSNNELSFSERLLLSFASSVAIVGLVGFILNYTSFGIHLTIIALILFILVISFSLLTFFRRRYTDDSFNPEFTPTLSGIKKVFVREEGIDKALSIILIILIIFAVSMTTYAVVKPKQPEKFTEFYILGSDGKMSNYPTQLSSGVNGHATIVIVNHEKVPTSYLLVYNYNGTTVSETNITLQDGQNISVPMTIVTGNTGKKEVELLLYKQPDQQNVYLSLRFWVTVV
jgi:uncharacterized membrane protein